ncbi:universal stress protein [Natrarchaeobaculum aegyptiacum]|uniref:Universal stress protein UspA n=1 Tax=Natrarchaeobaculum aegyptiacum TaxID=745377 RepID=A0A2Z2HTJ3_9EURY|nr:universal stress protein [Natrarchaeobaculum aegyptiacum]ARS90113.1 universal stress protein UspA [Natrarchaeobaculum aegyptiacum]
MAIVAAVDRSARAADAVEEAERLAEAFDDPVHVVHVLTRSEFVDMGRTAAEEVGGSISMDEVKAAARAVAAEAAADLTVPTEAVGLVGDPADAILEYADEHDARYVVVAGRRRSPTGKAVFGSVTQSVLLNADCPVVTSIEQ